MKTLQNLLEAWYKAKLSCIHERSGSIDTDIQQLDEERAEWQEVIDREIYVAFQRGYSYQDSLRYFQS